MLPTFETTTSAIKFGNKTIFDVSRRGNIYQPSYRIRGLVLCFLPDIMKSDLKHHFVVFRAFLYRWELFFQVLFFQFERIV